MEQATDLHDLCIKKGILTKMDKTEQLKLLHKRMIDEIQDFAIILMDRDGNILTWNKVVEKIKGYKENKIKGQNFRIFTCHRIGRQNSLKTF
ncbi:hypothetical protein BH09BAC2_BH09BAC2_02010 [soil metagenome]